MEVAKEETVLFGKCPKSQTQHSKSRLLNAESRFLSHNLRFLGISPPPSQCFKKVLPNVQNRGRGGGVKGFLNNVKKTADLVKWGIPDQSQSLF